MTQFGAISTATHRWIDVVKTADESVNSGSTGTTMQNDDHLFFAVAASTKYAFQFVFFFDTVDAADFKCQLTGPASPTLLRVSREAIPNGATSYSGIGIWTAFSSALSLTTGTITAGRVILDGVLQNGTNAGTVQLQWAQNVADASNTTVLAGSYVRWLQI